MHMYNFLCSDSLLYTYFFLFLSTLRGVYTRDCSYTIGLELFVDVKYSQFTPDRDNIFLAKNIIITLRW